MAAAPKSQYFLILSFCLDGNEVRKRQSGGGKKNWNGCWTNLEMIPSLEMALISSVHKNVKKYFYVFFFFFFLFFFLFFFFFFFFTKHLFLFLSSLGT